MITSKQWNAAREIIIDGVVVKSVRRQPGLTKVHQLKKNDPATRGMMQQYCSKRINEFKYELRYTLPFGFAELEGKLLKLQHDFAQLLDALTADPNTSINYKTIGQKKEVGEQELKR